MLIYWSKKSKGSKDQISSDSERTTSSIPNEQNSSFNINDLSLRNDMKGSSFISTTDYDYWVTLNTKWNDQLKLKASSSTNRTLGYWLKINNIEEKFKNAFLKQYPQRRNDLNQILTSTEYDTIASSFQWSSTSEGYNFWKKQHIAWKDFCKNK